MKGRRAVGKIDGPDSKGVDQVKNRTFSYSFGVSRVNMKKIHVDEILKKTDENLPGPDKYAKASLFGGRQGALEGSNYQYSMRKKLSHFERELEKEKKKPGPGYY